MKTLEVSGDTLKSFYSGSKVQDCTEQFLGHLGHLDSRPAHKLGCVGHPPKYVVSLVSFHSKVHRPSMVLKKKAANGAQHCLMYAQHSHRSTSNASFVLYCDFLKQNMFWSIAISANIAQHLDRLRDMSTGNYTRNQEHSSGTVRVRNCLALG